VSTVLQNRRDLHHTSNTPYVTVSQSFDRLQTPPHVIHRPFEPASSVACSKTDTNTCRQSSPTASGCQPDDDRRDITSWADCLRQLATALRRRQDTDDSGQAVIGRVTAADVGSLDQATKNQHYRDISSSNKNNNNNNNDDDDDDLPESKFDQLTTEHTRSIDELRCSLSLNAATVQGQSRRGTN